MTEQRHRIKRQILELSIPGKQAAPAFYADVRRLYDQEIAPLIERCCSEFSRPDQIHRIDRLELDLGSLDPNHFEADLVAKIAVQLRQKLSDCLELEATQAAETPQTPEATQPTDARQTLESTQAAESMQAAKVRKASGHQDTSPVHSQVELLTFFARRGALPWWADTSKRTVLEDAVQTLQKNAPDVLKRLMQSLSRETTALQRFVRHFNDVVLMGLCRMSQPSQVSDGILLAQTYSTVLTLLKTTDLSPELTETKRRNLFWEEMLRVSYAGQGPNTSPQLFWKDVLLRVAGRFQCSFNILIDVLRQVLSSSKGHADSDIIKLFESLIREQKSSEKSALRGQKQQDQKSGDSQLQPLKSETQDEHGFQQRASEQNALRGQKQQDQKSSDPQLQPLKAGTQNEHGFEQSASEKSALRGQKQQDQKRVDPQLQPLKSETQNEHGFEQSTSEKSALRLQKQQDQKSSDPQSTPLEFTAQGEHSFEQSTSEQSALRIQKRQDQKSLDPQSTPLESTVQGEHSFEQSTSEQSALRMQKRQDQKSLDPQSKPLESVSDGEHGNRKQALPTLENVEHSELSVSETAMAETATTAISQHQVIVQRLHVLKEAGGFFEALFAALRVLLDRLPQHLQPQLRSTLASLNPAKIGLPPEDKRMKEVLRQMLLAFLSQESTLDQPIKACLSALVHHRSQYSPAVALSDSRSLDSGSSDADERYLENAGLVILWPFLNHFFKHMDLLEKKGFKDRISLHRAVLLLQYIATEESDPAEYSLTLNRILCGMALETVFDPDTPISEEEAPECRAFLEAVIAKVPILKNMSPEGFRGSFLLRKGVLSTRDGIWLLRVTRSDFDVVLDRFPWGIGWVKLPWMLRPLQVEW